MQRGSFFVCLIDRSQINGHTRSMYYSDLDVAAHRSAGPAWIYSATELTRSAVEASTLGSALPWLLQSPGGDGHRVMTLPGFAAGVQATATAPAPASDPNLSRSRRVVGLLRPSALVSTAVCFSTVPTDPT